MKEKFRNIPTALQRQIVFRGMGGLLFFILSMILLGSVRDWYLIFPCFLCGVFLLISGFWLLYQSVKGNYMRLQGECTRIETVGLRRRIRFIYFILEEGVVKIPVQHRIRKLTEGDIVTIYVAEKTPVYEKDGMYIISSYYAMEIRTGGNHGKRDSVSISS